MIRMLAPVRAVLGAMYGPDERPGLAPGLVVQDDAGWLPATSISDGSRLCDLLDAANRQWQASAHVAASLAWKSYAYWVALPSVLGWAVARRVPLMYPSDVLVRFDGGKRLLTIGLRPSVTVAVLPCDAQARHPPPVAVRLAGDEEDLLRTVRESLLDAHLTPVLDAIQARVRVGRRTLLGSVSSGIAHGILRGAPMLPGTPAAHIRTLLSALGMVDLVELLPGADGEPRVRRRTCCLKFALPQAKPCAACCLSREPGRGRRPVNRP